MPPAKTPVQAPKSDAYTGMLVVSLVILIAGCVFLYLDWSGYSSSKPKEQVPAQLPRGGQGPAPAPQGGMGGGVPAPMGQMGGGPAPMPMGGNP